MEQWIDISVTLGLVLAALVAVYRHFRNASASRGCASCSSCPRSSAASGIQIQDFNQ